VIDLQQALQDSAFLPPWAHFAEAAAFSLPAQQPEARAEAPSSEIENTSERSIDDMETLPGKVR
jgi:hypothetical protein